MKTCKTCGTQREGGRCLTCRAAWVREYHKTLNFKQYSDMFHPLYRRSEKRKAVVKRYRASEKYKAKSRRNSEKFRHSERGRTYSKWYQKEYQAKYKYSEAYAITLLKRRGLAVTPETIAEKILQLKLKRKIHEIERQLNPSGSYERTDNMLPGIDLYRSITQEHA